MVFTNEIEVASVNFGDLSRNVEAKSNVLTIWQLKSILIHVSWQLTYHLKNGLLVCFLDSNARVFDYKKQLLVDLVEICVDHYLSFETCVLNGILNQVYHHLFHSVGVTDYKVW